jgi:hypothetical protein
LPPGYKDGSKDTNAAGDLIIWHTLLETASESKADLLFVTSEAKPDWWVLSDKQTLWPRTELIAEFHRRTGGRRFAIADLSVLLRALKAPEAVINEVVRAETVIYARPEDAAVVSIMREWLKAVYSLQEGPPLSADLPCDFVLYRDGRPVPVEVKMLRRPTDLGVISKGTIVLDRVREGVGGAGAILCLVYPSVISARRARRTMRLGRHLPPKVEVVIGVLREDGFVEVVTEAEE